jgi:ribonuclease-3
VDLRVGAVTLQLQRLVETLGYRFRDPTRLQEALTHRSYVNEFRGEASRDNERLEFLGDAVLDLIVSEALMERHPDAREGELSKLRARMVSEVALARVADRMGLGVALRLGRGEEMSGGRHKASVLADGLEALIAAIYLDGSYEDARRVVLGFIEFPGRMDVDAKTELQHRVQERLKKTPRYRLVDETGPAHDKTFVVEVLLDGQALERGVGRSKKEAEQRAAANALAALDAWAPEGCADGAEQGDPQPGDGDDA